MNLNELIAHLKTLFDAGKHQELKQEGENFLFLNDGNAELYLLLAKSCAALGEVAKVEFYGLMTLDEDANNLEALEMLAALKMQQQDNLSAQSYLQNILKIDSTNPRATVFLGDILLADKMYDGAMKYYLSALDTNAKSTLSASEYESLVQRAATIHFTNKEYDLALQLLEKYKPEAFSEKLTLLKKHIYTGMGASKLNEVIACVEALQNNVPNNAEYILGLVGFLNEESDAERKITLLGKCLALPISDLQKTQALRTRAELYAEQQKWALAIADYDALLKIQEDWFDYQRRSFLKEQSNDLKGAIEDITQAMKLMGKPYPPLLSTRGKLLLKGGLTDKAIADFTTLLNLSGDDDDSETYYNLGVAYNKAGDKANAVKMLIRAEMAGNEKAGELLMKSFSEHLIAARQKMSAKLQAEFKGETERNQRSPILSKAFGSLWIPNMYKFFLSNENEISTFPASVIKAMLSDAEKDMFLITPEGLLLFEGEEEPIEAYYKVEVESEFSVLIEVHPTKGSNSFNMRLMFHEGNLLLTYPVGEADIPAKYFIKAQGLKDDQKQRLTTKKLDVPYMETLESSISKLVNG